MGYYYRQSVCIEIDSLLTPAPNTFVESRGPLIEQALYRKDSFNTLPFQLQSREFID